MSIIDEQLLGFSGVIEVDAAEPDAVTLRVNGELEISNSSHFEAFIVATCEEACRKLVIDLTGCRYIDCSALAVFVRLSKGAWEEFAVEIRPDGLIFRVLEVCGFLSPRTFVRIADEAQPDS